MIGHAAEIDIYSLPEARLERLFLVMPFSGTERDVPRPGKIHRQGMYAFQLVIHMEKAPAAQQHGPAGHADGSMVSSHDIGIRKQAYFPGQLINMGSPDVGVPRNPERIGPLVICEKEKDVGLALFFGEQTLSDTEAYARSQGDQQEL